MKQKLLNTLIVITVSSSFLFADTINKKNGEELSGKILRITDKTIEFDPDGEIPFDIVTISEIENIVYSNGQKIYFSDNHSSNSIRIDGINKHDGFFLRFLIGGGYIQSSAESDNNDYELSGQSQLYDFALGYAVVDNIILFTNMRLEAAMNFNAEKNGTNLDDSTSNESISFYDFGIGLSYYLLSTNFYFSGGFSVNSVTYSNIISDTNGKREGDVYSFSGIGLNLSAGYEWWVSDNWGLGIAIYYHQSSSKSLESYPYNESFDFKNRTFGIAFSATYN
jgi:opacity protein-like surface antigen